MNRGRFLLHQVGAPTALFGVAVSAVRLVRGDSWMGSAVTTLLFALVMFLLWKDSDHRGHLRQVDDHIVYETDFPHPDSKYPHATKHFLELLPDQISEESKRKVLWDNAVDLYRFPAGYLPDESTFVEYTADAVPA